MRISPLANKELLADAINNCASVREILEYLGLRAAGGNYAMARKWAKVHELTLPSGIGITQVAKAHSKIHITDSQAFSLGSTTTRHNLKIRLRRIWSNWVCAECGIGEEWNGKHLSLQLDHINGIFNDHRIENLRLLCPNCHSQTETFAGKRGNKC